MAIRLDRSDIIDWLVKEVQENPTQIDIRVKKYVKYSTFKQKFGGIRYESVLFDLYEQIL